MDYQSLFRLSKLKPDRLEYPSPWSGHIPFALWLTHIIKPRVIVELGTYLATSYFNFCSAVKMDGSKAQCFGIGTWQGNEHSSEYGEKVFLNVSTHNKENYAAISRLLRINPSQASEFFSDQTIDLLHIDGLNTYEEIKHEFKSWLPKLAPSAVVLLHNVVVKKHGFSIYKFWDELTQHYPLNLTLPYLNGLGILQLAVGKDHLDLNFLQPDSPDKLFLVEYFEAAGVDLVRLQDNIKLQHNLSHLNQNIASLSQKLAHYEVIIADLQQTLSERETMISAQQQALIERRSEIVVQQNALTERDALLSQMRRSLVDRDIRITNLLSSGSWRITAPLRLLLRPLMRNWGLRNKFGLGVNEKLVASLSHGQARWGIITTQHTYFIAELIKERLQNHGWGVDIYTQVPDFFTNQLYIVICAQMFDKLPPGERRIVLQMEQSVSTRWFSSTYLEALETSLAVLDYALINIEFLSARGITYPHIHYLPIGTSIDYQNHLQDSEKSCDVLFYGDYLSCQRRREMLNALKPHCNLRLITEVFGHEIQEAIQGARLVINIHYYQNALLEMPRIAECLSLGVPVISESAIDQDDYPELAGAVRFFEEGSVDAMITTIRTALENPVPPQVIAHSVICSAARFAFMFDRFLVAQGLLPTDHVASMQLPLPTNAKHVVLSLPETIHRRRIFEKTDHPKDWLIFDGIRRQPGWVGCGLSYSTLSRHVLSGGAKWFTVIEDDVVLPSDFAVKLAVIENYLEAHHGDWDVFSGVIASIHKDTRILSVEINHGITFVTINKMTSMVFNIYSERVLRILACWNPNNLDVTTNTIDRYLERQSELRILTTLPFLVGHREDVHSTLWGFQNTEYSNMIEKSQQKLEAMVSAWQRKPY